MHRFFVTPEAIRGDQVRFSAEQARQLRTVLRMQEAQEVLVLDGAGACYRAQLQRLAKAEAVGRIVASLPATGEPSGDLILCQALARGDRFEWVLQKGVELGVTHFQPLLTKRTVAREPGQAKQQRWRRIIREAAEQSGRGKLPQLAQPLPFDRAIDSVSGEALIPTVRAEQSAAVALQDVSWPLTLFVGPEGGFDPAEIALAQEAGVIPVGLGPRILRTETAAITLAVLALAALGELARPAPRASAEDEAASADFAP